ncbi:chemotaxis protein CheW [Phenylobacterium sp. J367]|uniref:chemotaxis protein CheW n=1 Tax=Phenylobacterium sp. J367 TaxID=2898435 RepID=UPI002150D4D7|nr:chemotaxis protein CheW [Phenylobacterium sp. J367]MCR5881124.1 chemotaxis protein CheW [Phenylobacterium sp. J367]
MSPDRALLTFRVGDRRLAVAAADVTEVVRPPPVTRVPHAPAAVAGVTSLRGQVLPVVALDSLLDVPGGDAAGRRLVVLSGTPPLGLAVDEVTGLADGYAEPGALLLTDEGEARILALDTMLEAAFAGLSRSRARTGGGQGGAAPEASSAAAELALLGFELAGQPYALPLEQAREVLALPPEISALPRTDGAMLGVTTLRGALLPLVSTAVLLGLPPQPPGPGSRVIVAVLGDALIGLVVDRLTSILRAPPDALGPVPRVLNRAAGEAQVDSMLRLPGGRLVSVLTPERLFREASVAQILEDGRRAKAMEATTEGAVPTAVRKLLIFTLGDEAYGLPIEQVEEVAPMPDTLSRLPRAPAYVLGVMALRGAVIPVIAQRQRFGVEAAAPAGRPRVVVCRLGDLVAGFAVDAVTEILEVREELLGKAPELAGSGQVFDRVVRLDDKGRVLLVVDPQALLERAEADLIADLVREASAGP